MPSDIPLAQPGRESHTGSTRPRRAERRRVRLAAPEGIRPWVLRPAACKAPWAPGLEVNLTSFLRTLKSLELLLLCCLCEVELL